MGSIEISHVNHATVLDLQQSEHLFLYGTQNTGKKYCCKFNTSERTAVSKYQL